MALLIDRVAEFDVEIVDNWMFLYTQEPFPERGVGMYQRVFRVLETVGAKTLSQTRYYSDERAGSMAGTSVAPQGQQLRGTRSSAAGRAGGMVFAAIGIILASMIVVIVGVSLFLPVTV